MSPVVVDDFVDWDPNWVAHTTTIGCGRLKYVQPSFLISTWVHVYACGLKTVLAKRTFLLLAAQVGVGWGGVGWGQMLPSCEFPHIVDATLPTAASRLSYIFDATLGWGGVGSGGVWQDVTLMWTSTHLWCYAADILSRLSCIFDAAIDAAWSACKSFIPNSLNSKHKDLFLYCRIWQWGYILRHKNVAKETVKMRKSHNWKKKQPTQNHVQICISLN